MTCREIEGKTRTAIKNNNVLDLEDDLDETEEELTADDIVREEVEQDPNISGDTVV